MSNCRLCSVGTLELFLDLSRSLSNISRLCCDGYKGQIIQLKVWKCSRCGFVQLAESLPRDFYGDYIMGTSYTQKIKALMDKEAFLLREALQSYNRSTAIDIGCGDGEFLNSLEKFNFSACGTEPSKTFRDRVDKKFTVFDEYIHSDTSLGPYTVATAREVLEHVWDIQSFIQGMKKLIVPGGHGLIEVPRLEKAIKDNRFYDFFADHLNYFSEGTLSLLLYLNGFTEIKIIPIMNDEYNLAIFKNPKEVQIDQQKVLDSINNLIKDSTKEYIFWGAGGKGLSILTALNTNAFKFVIDDDPEKQGKTIPISDLPIKTWDATKSSLSEHSVIFISAMAYFDEILTKIQNSNFKGTVYGVGKEGVFNV